jgi:RNA polymerase sigma factor for flagellar operon FliA
MSDDAALWRSYRQARTAPLRERLIEQYLVLVKRVAARTSGRLPRHLHLDDLYSAGLLGLLGAIDDYDPDVGVAFSVYATPRIRGAIFDELRRLDLVPRGVRRRLREIERAIDGLTARMDRPPSDDEIAGALRVDVEAYRQFLGEGVTFISLDTPLGPSGEAEAGMDLEDTRTPGPLTVLAATERQRLLARLIDGLPERERQVLALYYLEELTMREVGQVLGVTESRVSQLHSSAVLRLRSALRRVRLREPDLTPLATGTLNARPR